MKMLKGLGSVVLGIGGFVMILSIYAFIVGGSTWAATHLTGYAIVVSFFTFAFCVVLLLPLAVFRRHDQSLLRGLLSHLTFLVHLPGWPGY